MARPRHATPHGLLFPNEVALSATLIAAALDPADAFRRPSSRCDRPRQKLVRLERGNQVLVDGWYDHPDTLPWLRERATTDPNENVRRATVLAIAAGWAGDEGILEWLRERATIDPNQDVRQTATKAIATG